MAEKRFFWIKLMDDFLWGDKVKFLMHQKNGAEYVVLYEMLCSLAKNSKGRLIKQLGNILIELDINAIYGELSGYFEYDTIVVAMGLFEKLDMVYQENGNGVFTIKDFDNMVGSESASAARVRRFRENARNEQQLNPPLHSNENDVTPTSQCNESTVTKPLQSNDRGVTSALQSPLHCNCRVKSTELDRVSKKENKEIDNYQPRERVYARESYKDVMDNLMVDESVRPTLWSFIQHCQLNGHTLTNEKLSSILIYMDIPLRLSNNEKIARLKDAINGGYYDIRRDI